MVSWYFQGYRNVKLKINGLIGEPLSNSLLGFKFASRLCGILPQNTAKHWHKYDALREREKTPEEEFEF